MFGKWIKILFASSFLGALFLNKKDNKNIEESTDKFNNAFKSEKNLQFIEVDGPEDTELEKVKDEIQSPG